MSTIAFAGIGTTQAGIANVETTYNVNPPYMNPPASLSGALRSGLASGGTRDDGFVTPFPWIFYGVSVDIARMNAQVVGGILATSKQVYVSTIDEMGYYSVYLAYWNKPQSTEYTTEARGYIKMAYPVTFTGGALQYVTKSSNATLTASERLAFVDSSGGNVTITLPAANTIQANTIVSVARTSASNTVTVQRGGSDSLDGGTSTTISGIYARKDFISDGTSAWTTRTVS